MLLVLSSIVYMPLLSNHRFNSEQEDPAYPVQQVPRTSDLRKTHRWDIARGRTSWTWSLRLDQSGTACQNGYRTLQTTLGDRVQEPVTLLLVCQGESRAVASDEGTALIWPGYLRLKMVFARNIWQLQMVG